MAHFIINPRSCLEWEDENYHLGTSLAVQWLRLQAPKAEGLGLIPVWGTKISHVTYIPVSVRTERCLRGLLDLHMCFLHLKEGLREGRVVSPSWHRLERGRDWSPSPLTSRSAWEHLYSLCTLSCKVCRTRLMSLCLWIPEACILAPAVTELARRK